MPPWEKYQSASPSGPWAKYGGEKLDGLALAKQVVQERPNTLAAKMAMGDERGETFGQYAGRSLKEMAIPMATTALGTAMGGIPGAMAGSAMGETINQAAGVYGKSVIPEVNTPDLARIVVAGAAPAVIPAVTKGVQTLGTAKEYLKDKIFPTKMAEAWLKKTIGPHTDEVVKHATAPSPIANYPQTAAEKLAGTNVGSVIQGHQAITAQSPGGISTEFAKLKTYQDFILKEAAKNRDAVTAPMREQALDAANGKFGVKATELLKYLKTKLRDPEMRGAPESKKAFEGIQKWLAQEADQYGRINAKTLYQFKKDGVDQVVDKIMEKANPSSAIKFKASNLVGVKQQIDATLDKASQGQWKHYLGEYSKRSADIDKIVEARELMYKPIQKTDLRGGVDLGTSAAHHVLPPWLSRPVTFTRWAAERIGSQMEPRIDRFMANVYQHPDQLAKILRASPGSTRNQALIEELLKRQAPLAAGAATQQQP